MTFSGLSDEIGVEIVKNLPFDHVSRVCRVSKRERLHATQATNYLLRKSVLKKANHHETTGATLFALQKEQDMQIPKGASTKLYSCGRNHESQLGWEDAEGTENYAKYYAFPFPVRLSEKMKVKQVSCGNWHTILLCDIGGVFAFGRNAHGQLGLSREYGSWGFSDESSPSQVVSLKEHKITYVSTGAAHTMFVEDNGSVWTCGRGEMAELGYENDDFELLDLYNVQIQMLPRRVKGLLCGKRVIQADAANSNSIVLTSDGEVFAWGWMRFGPQKTEGLGGRFATCVAAGPSHIAIVTSDGTLFTAQTRPVEEEMCSFNFLCRERECSLGLSGQERDTVVHEATYVQLLHNRSREFVAIKGSRVTRVSAGNNSTLCVTEEGKVFQFGENHVGLICTTDKTVTSLSYGFSHGALVAGNTMTWGENAAGELGYGITTWQKEPRVVNALPACATVLSVSCGLQHTCFVAYT